LSAPSPHRLSTLLTVLFKSPFLLLKVLGRDLGKLTQRRFPLSVYSFVVSPPLISTLRFCFSFEISFGFLSDDAGHLPLSSTCCSFFPPPLRSDKLDSPLYAFLDRRLQQVFLESVGNPLGFPFILTVSLFSPPFINEAGTAHGPRECVLFSCLVIFPLSCQSPLTVCE